MAIYGAHFFIRSVLELPIKGFTDWFGFGVRVSQKRETFYAYLDDFDSAENGPLFGCLSTRIDHNSEDTLNLNTKARFCGGGKRPLIELEPTDHPLAVAQREGVTLEEAGMIPITIWITRRIRTELAGRGNMMNTAALLGIGILFVLLSPPARTESGQRGRWRNLTDGKTLNGWHVSSQTGHGTGGKWVVEKGAIVGTQDRPGNGGIVITDKQFGDFEVELEMNNDYGPDSGLFMRSNEKGQAYQALIDYHKDGNLMGVYGEGIGGFVARNFTTLESPDKIRVEPYPAFPLSFSAERWPKLWKHGKWNKLRARIWGNPPTIHTWINNTKIMEWRDTEKRLPDKGGIALQVHGGGDLTGQFVRYRKVRVRPVFGITGTPKPSEYGGALGTRLSRRDLL